MVLHLEFVILESFKEDVEPTLVDLQKLQFRVVVAGRGPFLAGLGLGRRVPCLLHPQMLTITIIKVT